MKNIKRSLLITTAIGAFTMSAFAINLVPTSASLWKKVEGRNNDKVEKTVDRTDSVLVDDHFEEVQVSDLPQVVKSVVISKYVAYFIEQAFQENATTYRLVLKGHQKRLMVYYTSEGEYLRQETMKTLQVVTLM